MCCLVLIVACWWFVVVAQCYVLWCLVCLCGFDAHCSLRVGRCMLYVVGVVLLFVVVCCRCVLRVSCCLLVVNALRGRSCDVVCCWH